jgi:hypothetical protein
MNTKNSIETIAITPKEVRAIYLKQRQQSLQRLIEVEQILIKEIIKWQQQQP